MNEIRLLIVNGDSSVRGLIRASAEAEGYSAAEAADGIAALKLFRRNEYRIVLLDMELPELDGRNVCRQIRKTSDIPILIVSTLSDEQDKLAGFEAGADDYILIPFYPAELMARVRVFLHRGGVTKDDPQRLITLGGLMVDTVSRSVYIDERSVKLTPKEYDLLLFLVKNPNRAFSRDVLLNAVWGNDFFITDRTIDTHIKSLRENIRPYQGYIATVWGYGYKFDIG